jgi:hypothetical protein
VVIGSILQKLPDGFAQERMDEIGGDFGQGRQDESALVHARVGQDQPGRLDDAIVVQQEVQVNRSGVVFFLVRAAG